MAGADHYRHITSKVIVVCKWLINGTVPCDYNYYDVLNEMKDFHVFGFSNSLS